MEENLKLPLTPQPPKPFVKRHSRWLASLGTVILLGTFAVNDVKKENARDLSDSIERAQNAFYERSYYEDLRVKLLTGLDQIGKEKTKPINLNLEYEVFVSGHSDKVLAKFDIKPSPRNKHITMDQFDILLTEQQNIRYVKDEYFDYDAAVFRLNTIVDFNKRLPYDRSLDDEHWKIEMSLKLWRHVLSDVDSMKYASDAAERKTAAASFARDSQIFKDDKRHMNKTPSEWITTFNKAVLTRAESLRDDADRRAKFWKMWSFVLYPLGAILSFIGKLNDEDIPGAE
jgi:hypothetical protein